MNMSDIALVLSIVGLLAHALHLAAHRFGWLKVDQVAEEVESKTGTGN